MDEGWLPNRIRPLTWRSSLPNPTWRARWGTLDLGFLTLDLNYLSSTLLCRTKKTRFSFYHFFTLNFGFLIVWFFYLIDKTQTNPWLSLINVLALNYLLRSQIFVNGDGQRRATHLILNYEPISRTFLDVGTSIRANDYHLARIDVSRPGFLAPHDLPPVNHPILQGIPFATQPLQQVPLGQAVVEEETHLPLLLRKKLIGSDLRRKPLLYQRLRKKRTSTRVFKLLPQ